MYPSQNNSKANEPIYANPQHLLMSIRSILVVAYNDVCLLKFTHSLKRLMPNITVTTAQSSQEALMLIEKEKNRFSVLDGIPTHGYDVIIVDDRLQLQRTHDLEEKDASMTGFELLQDFVSDHWMENHHDGEELIPLRHSLLIGMLENSQERRMKEVLRMGVDMVWCRRELPVIDIRFRRMMVTVVNMMRRL